MSINLFVICMLLLLYNYTGTLQFTTFLFLRGISNIRPCCY